MKPLETYFDAINRTAIAITKKEPFAIWLRGAYDDTIERDLSDNNIYLADDEQTPDSVDEWLRRNFLTIFESELNEWVTDKVLWPVDRTYEVFREWHLTSGRIPFLYLQSPVEYGEACVKCRIAKGWSQAELAEKLGIAEQQVQRYEADNYGTVNITRLTLIMETLEMKLSGLRVAIAEPKWQLPPDLKMEADRINQIRERGSILAIAL